MEQFRLALKSNPDDQTGIYHLMTGAQIGEVFFYRLSIDCPLGKEISMLFRFH